MRCYRGLARVFPHSYRAKLMLVVLLGTTLPVSVFALWLMGHNGAAPELLLWGAVATTALTLVGTLSALLVIYHLLAPLRAAADALEAYYTYNTMPRLPDWGQDEMGRLLRGINLCLRSFDAGVRQLERHALEDPLTGAMNRRGCEKALAASVADCNRKRMPFVLFVLDMDNLKQINDQFGHAAGDHALRDVVASAGEILGEGDWIGRWGGDEFLLGLHDASDSARQRVGNWLQALGSRTSERPPVLVSGGCAELRDPDASALYRQADAAMYEAKFTGGHRLVCHGDPQSTRTIQASFDDKPAHRAVREAPMSPSPSPSHAV